MQRGWTLRTVFWLLAVLCAAHSFRILQRSYVTHFSLKAQACRRDGSKVFHHPISVLSAAYRPLWCSLSAEEVDSIQSPVSSDGRVATQETLNPQPERTMFIFGLGYVGEALALALLQSGGWKVSGTCRSREKVQHFQDLGVNALYLPTRDLVVAAASDMNSTSRGESNVTGAECVRSDSARAAVLRELRSATHVLATIPPIEEAASRTEKGSDSLLVIRNAPLTKPNGFNEQWRTNSSAIDTVLKCFGEEIFRLGSSCEEGASLRWIGYLSSTGVYGECEGAWVTEDSPIHPDNAKTTARAKAECEWTARYRDYLRKSNVSSNGRYFHPNYEHYLRTDAERETNADAGVRGKESSEWRRIIENEIGEGGEGGDEKESEPREGDDGEQSQRLHFDAQQKRAEQYRPMPTPPFDPAPVATTTITTTATARAIETARERRLNSRRIAPLHVFRLSGIYGPGGRSALATVKKLLLEGGDCSSSNSSISALSIILDPQDQENDDQRKFVSRIHIADIINVLNASMIASGSLNDTTTAFTTTIASNSNNRSNGFGYTPLLSQATATVNNTRSISFSSTATTATRIEGAGGIVVQSVTETESAIAAMACNPATTDEKRNAKLSYRVAPPPEWACGSSLIEVFNVADDVPSPRYEVLRFAAGLLGYNTAESDPLSTSTPTTAAKTTTTTTTATTTILTAEVKLTAREQEIAKDPQASSDTNTDAGVAAISLDAGRCLSQQLQQQKQQQEEQQQQQQQRRRRAVGMMRGGSKRVDNRKTRKLLHSAGLDLTYPNYQRGLVAILEAEKGVI